MGSVSECVGCVCGVSKNVWERVGGQWMSIIVVAVRD